MVYNQAVVSVMHKVLDKLLKNVYDQKTICGLVKRFSKPYFQEYWSFSTTQSYMHIVLCYHHYVQYTYCIYYVARLHYNKNNAYCIGVSQGVKIH